MNISFHCPGCGRAFSVDAHMVGSQAQCNSCGNVIVVPAAAPVVQLQPRSTIASVAPVVDLRPAHSPGTQPVARTQAATTAPVPQAASVPTVTSVPTAASMSPATVPQAEPVPQTFPNSKLRQPLVTNGGAILVGGGGLVLAIGVGVILYVLFANKNEKVEPQVAAKGAASVNARSAISSSSRPAEDPDRKVTPKASDRKWARKKRPDAIGRGSLPSSGGQPLSRSKRTGDESPFTEVDSGSPTGTRAKDAAAGGRSSRSDGNSGRKRRPRVPTRAKGLPRKIKLPSGDKLPDRVDISGRSAAPRKCGDLICLTEFP